MHGFTYEEVRTVGLGMQAKLIPVMVEAEDSAEAMQAQELAGPLRVFPSILYEPCLSQPQIASLRRVLTLVKQFLCWAQP